MNLIKMRLRNPLSKARLDQLHRTGTESPKDGHDKVYGYFVDELQKRNPNIRKKL